MMIKKQLGVLAGSVVLASSANAAIDISAGDVLVVFSSAGNGSFYQLAGATADDVVGGTGFSLDITAATGFLGSITDVAVFGFASAGADGAIPASPYAGYNYQELTYVDLGGGLLATNQLAPTTNTESLNKIATIDTFLNNANLGGNGEGSLGDFDGNATVADLLVSLFPSTLGLQGQRDVGSSTALTTLPGVLSLDGSSLSYAAVPVPAAAWLFGSALVGLGVVRRKK